MEKLRPPYVGIPAQGIQQIEIRDNSQRRRGKATVYKMWGGAAAMEDIASAMKEVNLLELQTQDECWQKNYEEV